MTRSFDVFFPLCLNKQLKKKKIVRLVISRHRAHYDVTVMKIHNKKIQRVYFWREFQRSAGRSGLNVSIYSSFLTPNIDQLRANQCRAIYSSWFTTLMWTTGTSLNDAWGSSISIRKRKYHHLTKFSSMASLEVASLSVGHNELTHYGIYHYNDVIMGMIASQITSLTFVYSTVYSGADHRKHQSSASLAFVWGIRQGPVNSPHKWPVTRKMFPFDDVIM